MAPSSKKDNHQSSFIFSIPKFLKAKKELDRKTAEEIKNIKKDTEEYLKQSKKINEEFHIKADFLQKNIKSTASEGNLDEMFAAMDEMINLAKEDPSEKINQRLENEKLKNSANDLDGEIIDVE